MSASFSAELQEAQLSPFGGLLPSIEVPVVTCLLNPWQIPVMATCSPPPYLAPEALEMSHVQTGFYGRVAEKISSFVG